MHDGPSLAEMIAAVKGFLDSDAMAELGGHGKFNARVASNVLATVLREIEQRPTAEAEEIARLQALLDMTNSEADLDTLNHSLITKIRNGEMDETNAKLLAHLKATAIAQLNIDQPRYSSQKS